MMPFLSTPTKNISLFISIALLGAISLTSCSNQAPTATVESTAPQAESTTTDTAKTVSSTATDTNKAESPTLKNLQAAYNGEANAHVMYLAFSKKAEEEGYKDVANLFKSVARAEEIHRDSHARVIESMGATPQNNITTPEIKSTADNLEKAKKGNLAQAIKGETYERDTMYPDFIKQAKAEKNQAAVQTFEYALAAETQHAQLYALAQKDLNAWKKGDRKFYVCTVSGETFENKPSEAQCPKAKDGKNLEQVS